MCLYVSEMCTMSAKEKKVHPLMNNFPSRTIRFQVVGPFFGAFFSLLNEDEFALTKCTRITMITSQRMKDFDQQNLKRLYSVTFMSHDIEDLNTHTHQNKNKLLAVIER